MARTTKRGKTGKKVAKKAAKKRAGSRTTKPAKTTAGAFSTTRARMAAMAAVPDTGPVTLEEARALAHVSQPAMAARAVRKEVAPPISPAAIGVEREKLKAEQRTERARRISEYRATMMVMKRRGARGPRAAAFDAAGGPPAAAADGSFDPLQILAEGDSWFDYPVPFFGGGIIPRLEHRLGVPILNLAKAGDEVRYMLGVEERAVLVENLTNGSPAGGPWDVLLFSGGGNDIVGNPMALWVDDWNPAVPPVGHIKKPRFDAALELVRAGYEDLIALRDQLSPHTMLVFQGYDFALPDGRGILRIRPMAKADIRPAQVSDARGGTGGGQGYASAVRGNADLLERPNRYVHQRPGNAVASARFMGQRTPSGESRFRKIRGPLPGEIESTLPKSGSVAGSRACVAASL